MKVEQIGENILRVFTDDNPSIEESVILDLGNKYFTETLDDGYYKGVYYQDIHFHDKQDLEAAKHDLKPWTKK